MDMLDGTADDTPGSLPWVGGTLALAVVLASLMSCSPRAFSSGIVSPEVRASVHAQLQAMDWMRQLP